MNDDELERSIRALREEGDRPAPQARLTRERILADLRPKARRRRAIWMIPLAAVLAGSTVLAATGRLPRAFHAAARALGLEARHEEPEKKDAARPARSRTSAPAPSAGVSNEPAPTEAAAEPATEEPSSATPRADAGPARHAARRAAHAVPSASGTSLPQAAPAHGETAGGGPPPGTASAAEDDQGTLALYRRARQLHFVEQKPAAALAAWDAYLAAEPRGPLSVDARYSRALCLVRLGRKQEARTALEPFAAGKYGSYRQNEARALLDALP